MCGLRYTINIHHTIMITQYRSTGITRTKINGNNMQNISKKVFFGFMLIDSIPEKR